MNWKIPLFKTYWDEEDVSSVSNVIRRGSFWAAGPEIEELEKEIANYIGLKYALTFNSGTSALHADILAHNINSGEVIVPSFTFIATANAVLLAGAKPIFAEVENKSFGLDPEDVKERITDKTKAIIPVHYGGAPCINIRALREIADDYDLVLIEDAAESLGSKLDNKMVGAFGHSSMFSFCQNKIITAGEGGTIVTNDLKIYKKLKFIRSHGRQENEENYFDSNKEQDYIQVGYNYRMSSISAALILSQLKKINKIISLRREKAAYYNKKLKENIYINIPFEQKNIFHVYQMYTILLKDNEFREKIRGELDKSKIMTRVYFEPIHLKFLYRKKFNYKEGDLPITEELSKKVLTLPLHPMISNNDIDYITEKINSC